MVGWLCRKRLGKGESVLRVRNKKKKKRREINQQRGTTQSRTPCFRGEFTEVQHKKKVPFSALFLLLYFHAQQTTITRQEKKKNGTGRRSHDGSPTQNECAPPTLLSALWNSFLFSPFKDQEQHHSVHSNLLHQSFKSPTVQRSTDIATKPPWSDTSVSYPSSITSNKRTLHQPRRFLENHPSPPVLLVSSCITIFRLSTLSPPSSTSTPNPRRLLPRQHYHFPSTPPTIDRTTIPHATSPSQQEIRLLHRLCGNWKICPPPTTHRKPKGTLQAGSGCCHGFNGDCGL